MAHDHESSKGGDVSLILLSLMNTNDAPSIAQLGIVDNALLALRAQAALLDEEIENVEDSLTHLRNKLVQRLGVEREIKDLECVKSSIRIMPEDVLRLIFEFSAPWGFQDGIAANSFNNGARPDMEPTHSLDMLECPWTIAQVCRFWRSIALCHGRLWTALHIDFGDRAIRKYTPDQLKQRIALIHARARRLPVRIFAELYTRHFSEVFWWMVEHYHSQWSSIRIESSFYGDASGALFLSEKEFPRLAHLYVSGELASPLFMKAPALRYLEQEERSTEDAAQLFIPWAQLTRYKSVNTEVACIAHMSNLEELDIEQTSDIDAEPPSTERTVLKKLGFLSVNENLPSDGQESVVLNLFSRFDFPALHTLLLQMADYETLAALEPGTFSPTLTTVSFGGIDLQSSHAFEALKTMPHVKRLHLSGMAVVNFIELMAEDPGVLAHLTDLHLSFLQPHAGWPLAVEVALSKLIEARASPLKRVAFFIKGKSMALGLSPRQTWGDSAMREVAERLRTKYQPMGIQVKVFETVQHINDFEK